MDIRLSYGTSGELTLAVDVGKITVTGDKALVDMASAWLLKRRIGEDTSVAGFFDSLKAGVLAIKKLADIPLVRRVVSAIPYGGTVLSGVDLAADAAKLGKATIRKVVPKKAALLISAALKGSPTAQAALTRAAARSPRVAARVRGHIKLMRDVQRLDEFTAGHRTAAKWSGRQAFALGPALRAEPVEPEEFEAEEFEPELLESASG
jgi:hypothetical protein